MTFIGHHIFIYNLPQNVEGGIEIHGYKGRKDIVLLFEKLDEMDAICGIEGREGVIIIPADTPIVEREDGGYDIEDKTDGHN